MPIVVERQFPGLPAELVRAETKNYEHNPPAGLSEVFGLSSNWPRDAFGSRTPPDKPDSVNNDVLGKSFLSFGFSRVYPR